MRPDLNWEIVQRYGRPDVCLGENHRFYFALFQYRHWKTSSTSADFGFCAPRICSQEQLTEFVIPSLYYVFFEEHEGAEYNVVMREHKPYKVAPSYQGVVYGGLAAMLIPAALGFFFCDGLQLRIPVQLPALHGVSGTSGFKVFGIKISREKAVLQRFHVFTPGY